MHRTEDRGSSFTSAPSDPAPAALGAPIIDGAGHVIATTNTKRPFTTSSTNGVFQLPQVREATADLTGTPLALADGRVLFVVSDALIAYEFHGDTFEPVWQRRGVGAAAGAPTVSADGRIVVSDGKQTVIVASIGVVQLPTTGWPRLRHDAAASAGF